MSFAFLSAYGFWVAVSFTINYVVGVGVLEIPNAFAKAGMCHTLPFHSPRSGGV